MDLRAAFASVYVGTVSLSAQEQAVSKSKTVFGKDGGGGEKQEVKEGMGAASRPLPPAKQALKDKKYALTSVKIERVPK